MNQLPSRGSSAAVHRAATLAAFAIVLVGAHAALTFYSSQRFGPVRLLSFLDLLWVTDKGISYSLFKDATWELIIYSYLSVYLTAGSILCAAISFLSIKKYSLQWWLVNLFAAAGLVLALEFVTMGFRSSYFSFHGWGYYLPVMSLPGIIFQFSIFLAYPYIVIRFFLRSPNKEPSAMSVGRLIDPFYESRYGLRAICVAFVLLSVWSILPLMVGEANTVLSKAGMTFYETPINFKIEMIVSMLPSFVIALFIPVVTAVVMWRLIPSREIDVIFFRAFKSDKEAIVTLKNLRRALTKRIRVTGCTNPREERRLVYLFAWLIMPILAIGNLGKANAFKHTVFLVGNWQDGVDEALHSTRLAVIDCSSITSSVAWELERALKTLGRESVFLVVPPGMTPEAVRHSLLVQGANPKTMAEIKVDNWIPAQDIDRLARVLRSRL